MALGPTCCSSTTTSSSPNGTSLTDTNYVPVPGPAGTQVVGTWSTNGASVTVSNVLGSQRLYLSAPKGSECGQSGRAAAPVTNVTVNVDWLSWIQSTKGASSVGGLVVLLSATNVDIYCDGGGCSTNLSDNPLLIYQDNGKIYMFPTAPDQNNIVVTQIGNWGSLAGTIMTNRLVLNLASRTFSLLLNGTTVTNNVPLPGFLTSFFERIGFDLFENSPDSAGNKVFVDDVVAAIPSATRDARWYIAAATFTCATDPLASDKVTSHADYAYEVTVDYAAATGIVDAHAADDVAPRPALGVDPYPDGSVADKGVGTKNPDGSIGAPITTDVVDTRP